MTLEDILKTAKQDLWDRPDEWIRKQYQKVGDKIPEGKLYHVTTAISLGPLLSIFSTVNFPSSQIFFKDIAEYPCSIISMELIGLALGAMISFDLTYNFYGLISGFKEGHTSKSASIDRLEEEVYKERIRIARFPFFIGGVIANAYSFYDMASTYLTEGSFSSPVTYYTLSGGIFLLGTASSMYLKDRDPKQFKKDPFWKRAYDAAAEKVKEYLPQPFPVPAQVSIPVRPYVSVAASL